MLRAAKPDLWAGTVKMLSLLVLGGLAPALATVGDQLAPSVAPPLQGPLPDATFVAMVEDPVATTSVVDKAAPAASVGGASGAGVCGDGALAAAAAGAAAGAPLGDGRAWSWSGASALAAFLTTSCGLPCVFLLFLVLAAAFKLWLSGLRARSPCLLRLCLPVAADAAPSDPVSFSARQTLSFEGCSGSDGSAGSASSRRRGKRGGRGTRRPRSACVLSRLRCLLRRAMVRLFARRFYEMFTRELEGQLAAVHRWGGLERDRFLASMWQPLQYVDALGYKVWGLVFWWLPTADEILYRGLRGWGEPPDWFREVWGPASYPAAYFSFLRLRWERGLVRVAESEDMRLCERLRRLARDRLRAQRDAGLSDAELAAAVSRREARHWERRAAQPFGRVQGSQARSPPGVSARWPNGCVWPHFAALLVSALPAADASELAAAASTGTFGRSSTRAQRLGHVARAPS